MIVGDLVEITRSAIGVPPGTVGLITRTRISEDGVKYHSVMSLYGFARRYYERRWLARDLKLLS